MRNDASRGASVPAVDKWSAVSEANGESTPSRSTPDAPAVAVAPPAQGAAEPGREDGTEEVLDAARQMLAWCEREGESLSMAVRHCRFTSFDFKRLLAYVAALRTSLSAAEARARESATREAQIRRAGGPLSNIAYNLAQSSKLDESTRADLDRCRKAWDAAVSPSTPEPSR